MGRKKLIKTLRGLPGKLSEKEQIERMIRVDHAGEYGAVRIYKGQLSVLGKKPIAKLVSQMLEHEKAHLSAFENELIERKIRPTALLPFWHILGFVFGAGSALLGKKAAMACTVAVEEVIDKHYSGQIKQLENISDEEGLKVSFEKFREEELEHKELGLALDAEKFVGHSIFSGLIKVGSRLAISLSTRL